MHNTYMQYQFIVFTLQQSEPKREVAPILYGVLSFFLSSNENALTRCLQTGAFSLMPF